MFKSLFKKMSSPKSSKEQLTELDITRVVKSQPVEETPVEEPEATTPSSNIDVWKQNDLDLLLNTWQACCDKPDCEETAAAFHKALHNLHGASGAYGGGALTRLTGSLQQLVDGVEDLQPEAPLINLHVQACRATAITDGEAADDVADAVCDALEHQVAVRKI